MTTIARDIADELRMQGEEPEDYAPKAEAEYPKPDVREILERKEWLLQYYQPLHQGSALISPQREGERYSGINGLRNLRYGRDETPEKLYRRLSNNVRIRSGQSHKLIMQVRSLLSRNPMKVRVPAAGGSTKALAVARIETNWSNELAASVARASLIDPVQESDDAQCEAFGGWEVYLTDAWKKIDFEREEGEDDQDYDERLTRAKREAGLPFGVRSLDPLSTLIDVDDDGRQIEAVIIVERKRRKSYLRRLQGRAGYQDDLGGFAESGYGDGSTGECEVTRYWDPEWYAEVAEERLVICERHGLPGIPVFPAWGFITSSRNLGDKFQGVAYGVQLNEAAANDVLTQEADSRLTFNRVKPIAEAPADAPAPEEDALDLSGPDLKLLPPGYVLKDAYSGFKSQAIDPSIGMILGLGQNQGPSQVLSGNSPSADASGFSLNLLTSNAIGPYLNLLTNKAVGWGKVIDFCRQTVKVTLKEPVELVVEGAGPEADRVEWVELKPSDVTDIPCVVTIQPIGDAERIAFAKYYLEGVLQGFVPERILQELGYNSPNVEHWREEIGQDKARRILAELEVQQAMREIMEEEAAAAQAAQSGLVGPNGQPISSVPNPNGMPQEPRPSSVGRENVPSSGGQAGQRPLQQGFRQPVMNGA